MSTARVKPARVEPTTVVIEPGEEAHVAAGGTAVIESGGDLPLRVRAEASRGRSHPGTAVVLGRATYEVVAEDETDGGTVYQLRAWPAGQVIRDRVTYDARFVREVLEQRRRERWSKIGGPLAWLVTPVLEMFAALLPEAERRQLFPGDVNVGRGTLLLAAIGVFGGGIGWAAGLVDSMQQKIAPYAGSILDTTETDFARTQMNARFGILMYLVTPRSLLCLYAFFTGLVRFFHTRTGGSAMPDPLLALALGALRRVTSGGRARARLAALGPERADRVVREGESLVVLSAREKPEWTARATIQARDGFYRVQHVADRADGEHTVIAYRLARLPEGSIYRNLVQYANPGETPAAAEEPEEAGIEVPAPATPVRATRASASAARPSEPQRDRWRIDDGEEAWLTEDGGAVIDSLGSLPLRPRAASIGVHHRPEFPGACVRFGGRRWEVVEEEPRETGFRYLLEPWRADVIVRDTVDYGRALVRAAQAERQRALEIEDASWWTPALYPFLGLLPAPRQEMLCERWGLDAGRATAAGALLETLLGVYLWFVPSLGFLLISSSITRWIGAVFWNEVAGSVVLGAAFAAAQQLRVTAQRYDATVLPITREAFWARLALPDRRQREDDGSIVVRALLPHLSWGSTSTAGRIPAIESARGEFWNVAALPPVVEKGRLVFLYQLWPMREEGDETAEAPTPPDTRHDQTLILEDVSRQWDEVFASAAWIPPLLPPDVQARAYHGRGGAAGSRRWTVATAVFTALAGLWFLFGRGPFNKLTAMLLLAEAGWRLWLTANDRFAPSLVGWAFADYLTPERKAYHAHRDAERAALASIGRARS